MVGLHQLRQDSAAHGVIKEDIPFGRNTLGQLVSLHRNPGDLSILRAASVQSNLPLQGLAPIPSFSKQPQSWRCEAHSINIKGEEMRKQTPSMDRGDGGRGGSNANSSGLITSAAVFHCCNKTPKAGCIKGRDIVAPSFDD